MARIRTSGIGTSPLGESGILARWNLSKCGVGDDGQNIVVHLGVILLDLELNSGDKTGYNREEQSDITPGGIGSQYVANAVKKYAQDQGDA